MSTMLRFPNRDPWLAWRAERPRVGGSTAVRLVGAHPFRGTPSLATADAGHRLEPLIIDRYLTTRGLMGTLDPSIVVAVDAERDDWHASLDGHWTAEDGSALILEAKAVFLGQREHWPYRRPGVPLSDLAPHVYYQCLWACGITKLPCVALALFLDAWTLEELLSRPDASVEDQALHAWTIDPADPQVAEDIAEMRLTVAAAQEAGALDALLLPAPTPRAADLPLRNATPSQDALLNRWWRARAALAAAKDTADSLAADIRRYIPPEARGLRGTQITVTIDRRGTLRGSES